MTDESQDMLFDLLTKKAIYGLDETEQRVLDEMDPGTAEMEFSSLEIAAAAVSMIAIEEEPMPTHLYSKILENADQFLNSNKTIEMAAPWPPAEHPVLTYAVEDAPRGSWFNWLGWAAAAAACIALAVNIWYTRSQPTVEVAQYNPPVTAPQPLTPAELRDEMMRSATGTVKAAWATGNVKEMKQLAGDVVWSDEKQAGYMRLQGLPINDKSKETYQLWIFDKTQDKATPIDGGTFDVSSGGEVVIPINAKLKAQGPEMFAITIEKPGGVVVSKRERVAALAKVETLTRSNS